MTLLFPVAARYSKSLPFAFFAAMMLVQFFVVKMIYPETKGYSLEDLQQKMKQEQALH